MIFYITLRLDEVDLALNVLLYNPLSISLRATFLVLLSEKSEQKPNI